MNARVFESKVASASSVDRDVGGCDEMDAGRVVG